MALDQLPGQIREFANYLDGLLARLDQRSGWCAVFWQRDPDGMRACLEGREVPPWDVVEALLQDLATEHGTPLAAREAERARPLHLAALTAYDGRPGGRDALGGRLDVMLREQRYAVERQAELGRLLAAASTPEEAEALRLDLAWAHDDHERATARCAELRYRIAEFDRRAAGGPVQGSRPAQGTGGNGGVAVSATASVYGDAGTSGTADSAPASSYGDAGASGASYGGAGASGAGASYDDVRASVESLDSAYATHRGSSPRPAAAGPAPADSARAAPAPKQRKRRRGSARFAGMVEEEAAPVVVPPAADPVLPAPAAASRRSPRGARFAGVGEAVEARPEPQPETSDVMARRETAEAVERLVRLRGEGRSGEAHALLVELAYGPAARIPLLAAELQRAGLTADWTTLLWEAASLPADRLVAAADALVEAGRTADGEQILRQGVVRPAEEIGEAVGGLMAQGRRREGRALLEAYVRGRAPEEVARSAAPDPQVLVPLLLEAARGVSDTRRRDLAHALRVAGFTT
ncbi:hypothetical protein [Streptomyces aurantiogriseus]|uniref:UL36 very large tegument protein n=1 Tax=Streptomyces aurantiogriseus TaxID=66870 RepID=A0A918BXR5_9ACTN|nr:hypothetical protein [Streptomyces aurantiogriseus]GGQ95541.1 hypothetical protein GCM10010251_07690 [Streptomyces aurantiogriseus]